MCMSCGNSWVRPIPDRNAAYQAGRERYARGRRIARGAPNDKRQAGYCSGPKRGNTRPGADQRRGDDERTIANSRPSYNQRHLTRSDGIISFIDPLP